jgi:acid phosphatase type 7
MFPLSRRDFFAGSAAVLAGSSFAADDATKGASLGVKSATELVYNPDTLFLTWHRDPTTTMVVQWVGVRGESPDTAVYVKPVKSKDISPLAMVAGGPAANTAWRNFPSASRPYPLSDYTHYRVELTGLTPNTDYIFKIGKLSPEYRFRTMPAKATDTFHFVSGGDVGCNVHSLASNRQAAAQDPSFAIIGGDLGYDNGRSVATSLTFLRNYARTMIARDNRLIPMVTCIGNHEVDGGYDKPRAKAPFFYTLFDGLFKDNGYATLDFGDYLSLVLLDTGHTAPIAGDQTDWLERQLKARKDHPHTFAVGHVPCYPSARKATGSTGKPGTGELQRQHWSPLFDKYRTPVALEHHDHTFKRSRPLLDGRVNRDGVVYLGDGSWGRLRAAQPAEKLTHLAEVHEEYHLSVHRLEGDERFHLAITEDGKVTDVARTGQRPGGIVPTRM